MIHPDRKKAKGIDTPYRCKRLTDFVYGGTKENDRSKLRTIPEEFYPEKPEYNVYFGDIHGHSDLSDGSVDIDTYFTRLRDVAKLDFGALSDHDHGGVGKEELFYGKWEIIKQKTKEYNEPHKFTTILAYERDSYPWYNNLVVYFDNYDGTPIRDGRDGEMKEETLKECLKREDILLVPHDTQTLSSGSDLSTIPVEYITPLIQLCSRGHHGEKFDEANVIESQCEGGYWQDALKRGARMGCIGCTDDHLGFCGLVRDDFPYPMNFPAITGVWAKENTLEGIFDALKKRRCFAFMGGRMTIDFRINGHYMGEEFDLTEDREIYFNVTADAEIKSVTLVKNCRDYVYFPQKSEMLLYDYKVENETDYYYLRVKLVDGRTGWSSPIWINNK
jgi:hypothetical protein